MSGPASVGRGPQRRRATPALGVLLALLVAPCLAEAPEEDPRPVVGGGLGWVAADELNLVGDLWADLPYWSGERDQLFVAIDTRTNIASSEDFTFLVRDLDYAADLGWRSRRDWTGGRPLSVLVGQRGKERLDVDGRAWVRYAGIGLESSAFRGWLAGRDFAEAAPVAWRFTLGGVIDELNVDADLLLRGDVHARLTRVGRTGRFDLDLDVDSLIASGEFDGDVAAGPSLVYPVGERRRIAFYAHYQSSDNPLGLGVDTWILGFDYVGGSGPDGHRDGAPQIDGLLAIGGGESGSNSGELRLRFLSPEFGAALRGIIEVDANALTTAASNELYYLYYGGIETNPFGAPFGIYFYHRSNHLRAQSNDEVTSINVLETGIETGGWHRTGIRRTGRWTWIDLRFRIGYLVASDFGEDRRWHLRGGLRWRLPFATYLLAPYLLLEGETGDVDRQTFALGIAPANRLELQLEYRDDDQFFGPDKSLWLFTVRHRL
jgi:hypothetical protein